MMSTVAFIGFGEAARAFAYPTWGPAAKAYDIATDTPAGLNEKLAAIAALPRANAA